MQDNRRDYYRIQEKGLIEYHLYDSEPPSLACFFRHPAYFEMMNEIQSMDVELNHLLGHLGDQDRNLVAITKIMNKKTDLIARTIALAETDYDTEALQDIDISEGGMSFGCQEQIVAGQKLALKLTLIPSCVSVTTLAEVVESENLPAGNEPSDNKVTCRVRLNFVDLGEPQRQLLARHILRSQQLARREQLAKSPD